MVYCKVVKTGELFVCRIVVIIPKPLACCYHLKNMHALINSFLQNKF